MTAHLAWFVAGIVVGNLIARIKAEKFTPELFDGNSLFVDSCGDHDFQAFAIKSPCKPTEEQLKEYRAHGYVEAKVREQNLKAASERKKIREQEAAERERERVRWEAQAHKAAQRRYDAWREWEEAKPPSPMLGRRTVTGGMTSIVVGLIGTSPDLVSVTDGKKSVVVEKKRIRGLQTISVPGAILHELTFESGFVVEKFGAVKLEPKQ